MAEPADWPLDIEIDVGQLQSIDTDGIAEWRSFWGELPRMYQTELEPAATLDFTWKVTP